MGCLLLGALSESAAHDWFVSESALVSLSTGAAQVFDSHQEWYWSVNYRPASRFHHVAPWMSYGTGGHDEYYVALGVLMDIEIGRNWVLTPIFGGGYYDSSNGLDLGFGAQFRTGIELARRIWNGNRIGISCAHISNGSLSDKNPGTESFGIVYSVPLDILFRPPASSGPLK